MTDTDAPKGLTAFIDRWRDAGGTERANYQLFLTELCTVLDLPRPDPATALTAKERVIHEQGLVAVLAEIHDALDREVLAAEPAVYRSS